MPLSPMQRSLVEGTVPHRSFNPLVRPAEVIGRWAADPGARAEAVRRFEAAIACRLGVPHVIVTSSGRVALQAIFAALELPPGAPVWLPVNTYDGLLPGIAAARLVARFADVGIDHQVDPADLEARLATSTGQGVVVATHMWGMPCDLLRILAAARRAGLPVVEDCAHAFGVDTGGVTAGLAGVAGLLSFQARKAINTLGGGAVVTRDAGLADRVRRFVDDTSRGESRALLQLATYAVERQVLFARLGYGVTRQVFEHAGLFDRVRSVYGSVVRAGRGGATRLSPLQAMLGTAQVEAFDARQARLDRWWAVYDETVSGTPGLSPPASRPNAGHGRYMYVLKTGSPAALGAAFWRRGIGTTHGTSLVPCLDPAGYDAYPGARRLLEQSLQLPFADGLSEAQFERVVAAVRACGPEAR